MSDIKKLLENEVLSEEVKGALNEAILEQINTVKAEAIEEAKNELEAAYATKFEADKAALSERAFSAIDEMVKEEIAELKEDIEYYKNIEVDYAKRLQEFKEEYAAKLAEGFDKAVSEKVEKEFSELREDITEAKKEAFGRTLYEAFASEFQRYGLGETDRELRAKLEEAEKELTEAREKIAGSEREKLVESLLSDLSGRRRDVMATILENTPTEKLEERYNRTIDKVLSENEEHGDNKTNKLTESKDEPAGDDGIVVNENEETPDNVDDDWDRVLKLAKGNPRRR